MLVENGLNGQGFFEVQSQDPSLISPSKTGPGSPMEVEGKEIVLVTEEVSDPMPQFSEDGVEKLLQWS